jgi:membrane-associated HD superfamily phosphohydrolase
MTDRMMNILLIKLKVIALILGLALISLFSFSFTTSERLADDIWKQLGMTKIQGTEGVKQSFLNGYLYYYGAKNARNIAAGNRAAVAKDLLTYTKQYIGSETFKKEYEQLRKQAKPVPSERKVRTKEEIRKEELTKLEKSVKESQEIMKTSAEMEKIMKPVVEMNKKYIEDYKKPDNKTIEAMYQNELYDAERNKKYYQESVARWEKEFPADYRQLIAARLQKYLDLAATVDFNAELKQAGNKKKFVNPVYEGKAYDWKQVYRAGKEVYNVAKPFAEQWIKELGVAAPASSKEPAKTGNNQNIYGNGK